MAKRKWYVVWRGAKTGVFDSWDACKSVVQGVEGAQYKSYASLSEAEAAFRSGYQYTKTNKTPQTTKKQGRIARSEIIWESISVDAACSGNPGIMEYRGVHTRTGEEIFRQGPFQHATNNIGEFLALIHGIAYLQKTNRHDVPIYSDSRTALAWVRNRKMKSELERIPKNEEVWVLVDRAVRWMEQNDWKNPLIKWETEDWGEIPADFGRK